MGLGSLSDYNVSSINNIVPPVNLTADQLFLTRYAHSVSINQPDRQVSFSGIGPYYVTYAEKVVTITMSDSCFSYVARAMQELDSSRMNITNIADATRALNAEREEENLRLKYPSVANAYNRYKTLLKLCEGDKDV